MGLTNPWIQFMSWLAFALVAYGVFVVIWLKPTFLIRLLHSSRTDSKPSDELHETYSPDNIMGPIRVSTYVPKSKEWLGSVSVDSSLPVSNITIPAPSTLTEDLEEEVFTFALDSGEEYDFSEGEGMVDLDRLGSILSDAASLIEYHGDDSDADEAVSAKSHIMSVIAADDFLTSTDFARQLASTLDTEVPTSAYSGVDALQTTTA